LGRLLKAGGARAMATTAGWRRGPAIRQARRWRVLLINSGRGEKIPRRSHMTSRQNPDVEGKRAAFETAAVPFMKALYNAALRLTHRTEDAADLVQETYLRAYRTFENFTPGTNCKAWLFTILYSIFINQYRQAKRRPRLESLEEVEQRFHHAAQPGDPLLDASTVEAWGWRWSPEVERALRQLPEDFRTPLLLVDVEGFSYQEAASILGCAVGTVGSRLFRGRVSLFATLQEYAHQAGYGKRDSPDP
jgi:RNA polymerase sigma-70 factor, ECF subfamily